MFVVHSDIWNTVESPGKISFNCPRRLIASLDQTSRRSWRFLQHAHTIQSLGHVGVNKTSIELSEMDLADLYGLGVHCGPLMPARREGLHGRTAHDGWARHRRGAWSGET
jgi:hypothetical protein